MTHLALIGYAIYHVPAKEFLEVNRGRNRKHSCPQVYKSEEFARKNLREYETVVPIYADLDGVKPPVSQQDYHHP